MKKDKSNYHSIKKPNFLGGKKAYLEFLAKHLIYPAEALENKRQGMAHVKCEINDKGKVLEARSINHLGFGMDEEAERIALLMQFDNTQERGMRIKHTHTIRIPFVLPKIEIKEVTVTTSYNYQTVPTEKKEEEKKSSGGSSYSYTIKF